MNYSDLLYTIYKLSFLVRSNSVQGVIQVLGEKKCVISQYRSVGSQKLFITFIKIVYFSDYI